MLGRASKRRLAVVVLGAGLLWLTSRTTLFSSPPSENTSALAVLRHNAHTPDGSQPKPVQATMASSSHKPHPNVTDRKYTPAPTTRLIKPPVQPTHPIHRVFNKTNSSNKTIGNEYPTKPFPASAAELFRTHDVTNESSELLDELYRRSQRVDNWCRQPHARGKVMGLFTHDPSHTAYCFIPKAGCTFWIRVFSYLHNYTGDVVDSPWDIPRLKVHNHRFSHGVPWRFVRGKVQEYLRFMFVRHPFSRLWSAYLDKLFLPDFWQEIGIHVVRKLRGKRAKPHARRCGNDVTFSEFVQYSLTAYEPHWEPIYLRCDPCQYRPALIGSMKTFSQDSQFLLRRMGLEWVLKDMDHQDQEEQELTTLIRYNFNRIHSVSFYKHCINDTKLAPLLWRTFQMNGYIPVNLTYPGPSSGVASVEEFTVQVVQAFRESMPSRQLLKKQKHQFLREALDSLPRPLMERVKAKYKYDMLYFGFDETNY